MSDEPARAFKDQYMLRLPDGMRERIKAAAEANKRSMNLEIVATLEEKYPPRDDLHLIRAAYCWEINSHYFRERPVEDQYAVIKRYLDYVGTHFPSADPDRALDDVSFDQFEDVTMLDVFDWHARIHGPRP